MTDLVNAVYFLLLAFLLASIFYVLDKIYRYNKKLFFITLLFPPIMLIYIWNHFQDVKENVYYFFLFIFVIILLGFITGKPYIQDASKILFNIFLWHIYFTKLII